MRIDAPCRNSHGNTTHMQRTFDLAGGSAFGSRRPQRSMVCRYISRTIDAQFRDVPTYFTCLSDIVDAIC